jgi:N-acyl amino acid synthase of PEP-CTERM/exosortase system
MEIILGNANLQMHEVGRATPSLYDTYSATFKTEAARTTAQQEACFRLRYQVYCLENHFLDIEDNPGGLETDAYDAQSAHTLLMHRASDAIVGTVRLVLPVESSERPPLPLYESCPEAMSYVPLTRTAEISRFAVSKNFRQRKDDQSYGKFYTREDLAGDARRLIPHLTLGLMQSVVEMSRDNAIDYLCAIMDPALLRLLSRLGIHFTLVGKPIEYHGLRQPCYAELGALLASVEQMRFDVWEVLTDRGNLWPALMMPMEGTNEAAA